MGYVQLATCALLWALTYHAGKFAVGLMLPLAAVLWRFSSAVLVLLPLIGLRQGWQWQALRRNVWPLLAMGLLGVAAFNISMFYGLQRTSAVNAALIMAFSPILTAVGSAILDGERTGLARGAGLLLGLLGVTLVVTHGSVQTLLRLGIDRGDLLMLIAALAWAILGLVPRRFVRGLDPLQMTGASLVIATAALWLLCAVVSPASMRLPPPHAAGAVLFMGVLATALAYVWWNAGVLRLGAARAAGFLNLVPVFTVLTGLLLGQPLSMAQGFGAVLVISGVALSARG